MKKREKQKRGWPDCVIWPGCKDQDGYGHVRIDGKMQRAHRVALERRLGRKLAPGECALHVCHNPPCVNAEHLRPGTVAENNAEARARKDTLGKKLLRGELFVVAAVLAIALAAHAGKPDAGHPKHVPLEAQFYEEPAVDVRDVVRLVMAVDGGHAGYRLYMRDGTVTEVFQ